MSNNGNTEYNNLFSSLISDVKSYTGNDPLLPWLRGIKKMKETLPPRLLKEKLPRFLQKCAEAFVADHRYSNDLRYLRVWLQLMDFVDDPKSVLRTMEKNRIGLKKSLFYKAYALYYEKIKKFDAAEKIYHLGVQNVAEPADELQKSYEEFLQRQERHNNKRVQLQGRKTNSERLKKDPSQSAHNNMPVQEQLSEKPSNIDEQLAKKSVDKVEDVRHHGLVEPTINTKEAMNAINSMFSEPLIAGRTSKKNEPKVGNSSKNAFTVFSDEKSNKNLDESFEIYVDGEEANAYAPLFARPNDEVECLKDQPSRRLIREDTVVSRFVSNMSDEHEVENVWHHGLVDPTVNLKEAMADINNMFGEPIEFTRKSRSKKNEKEKEKAPVVNNSNCGEFSILPDDEAENEPSNSGFMILPDDEMDDQQEKGSDLFEKTLCTKEAMDEINKLFAMPMDF